MPLAYSSGKTIFFAHVPKAGGTSIKDYLLRRFDSLALLGRNDQPAARGTSLLTSAEHLSSLDLKELLPADLDWSFAVVRDPAKRLISEYRFQRGISRASRVSFSTWLRIMIAAARRDPRVYDNHIRPQVDLLPEGTEVFRLEDGLDQIITCLDDIIGQKMPDLTVGHLLRSKSEPILMSREDIRLLVNFYAEDYARFGYSEPDYSAFPKDRLAWLRDLIALPLSHAVVVRQRRTWLQV